MRKLFKNVCTFALVGSMVVQPMQTGLYEMNQVQAGVADEAEFAIPGVGEKDRIGAEVPYTRYDSEDATISGGAALLTSYDFNRMNIASQASNQSYVNLPSNGSAAEWTMTTTGQGVTMRFTLPDTGDGMGQTGSLDIYVNDKFEKRVDLTSYFMWQYFAGGNPSDTNDGGAPCFAFDEVHFLLDESLKEGDRIKVQSSGANGLVYGVDFLEIENVAAPIEQPGNSLSVEDYGAVPDDGVDDYAAIYQCMLDADAAGMDVYIPEGTFEINQTWRLYGSDMKITGAGMWYTNIQFTNSNRGMGGISGGWQTQGSLDGYCNNIEFCNMYINSNLRSRYNQEAVYKCFMDVFTDGSVIHDVWEEHFECGFWLGDYNGKMDYSDGLKIIDCRIRNNLADGVNFCQGTSNAVVYNCSIRNNGDDGLAMWNNNYMNAKDESNNVFAYNTIDFIWRAGGIAIYGGNGHKIYNNYIRDMFMASGIHLNTTFDGYKFTNNTSGILFENNALVRCGTSADSWNEELGAVDIKQNVSNVTFKNTLIYDAVHDGVRILDNSPSDIKFYDTIIFGAGVDGQEANYSSVYHHGAALRLGSTYSALFDGLQLCNIAYKDEGTPYFFTGGATADNVKNVTIYDEETTYEVLDYPSPNNTTEIIIVNPYNDIIAADLVITGLEWKNANGSSDIKSGDEVTFSAAVKNIGSQDIPANLITGVKFLIDGSTSVLNSKFNSGIAAGKTVKISGTTTWSAVKGGHSVVATVDYLGKFKNELNKDNNTRTKNFNVLAGDSPSYDRVTGGYDLICTDITWDKDAINVGDQLVFTATIVNAGDTDIPSGTVIGYQVQVDSNTSDIRWCDTYSAGLNAGQSVKLTCNSGTNGLNYWTATEGKHEVMVWVDDVNRISNEVNENNNQTTVKLVIPDAGLLANPDLPDDVDSLVNDSIIEEPTTKPEDTTTEKETTTEEETTQSSVETAVKLEINGFQISSTVEGFRTVYSVGDDNSEVDSVGMIYALADKASADQMYVGSTSDSVMSYDATPIGKLPVAISSLSNSQTYVMTMKFGDAKTASFLSTRLAVRPFAKLKNGTYVYGDVKTFTIYSIANALYQGKQMSNFQGHEYLYNDILKVVDPSYEEVDYSWNNILAKPDEL